MQRKLRLDRENMKAYKERNFGRESPNCVEGVG